MKLTRVGIVVVGLVLTLSMFAGCSKKNKVVKVGRLMESKEEMDTFVKVLEKLPPPKDVSDDEPSVKHEDFINHYSITDLVLAMNSGKIDIAAGLPDITVRYLHSKDAKLNMAIFGGDPQGMFVMAFRPEDNDLRAKISGAIDEFQKDGTLESLNVEYLEKVITSGKDPVVKSVESVAGRETIKVAVTGDMPPLDYVSSDGKPAGYNVALMNKIAEKLGMNVEFVPVTVDARNVTLTTKKVDILFWFKNIGSEVEDTNTLIFSKPYYVFHAAGISKTMSAEEMMPPGFELKK